MKIERGIMIY